MSVSEPLPHSQAFYTSSF